MSLSDFDKELLDSAAADAPTAAQRARNRAAVMKAAGFVAGASTTSTTSSATKAAEASRAGASLASSKTVVLAGVAVAVLSVAAAFVYLRGDTTSAPATASPTGSASASASASAIASATAPPTVSPSVPVSEASAPVVVPEPVTPKAPATSAASATTNTDPLAEEARLLEQARSCADKRELTCASARLHEYRTRFPHGVLADEATLVQIQVERRGGNVNEARRLASELLRGNPNGPYARRALAILDELSPAADR